MKIIIVEHVRDAAQFSNQRLLVGEFFVLLASRSREGAFSAKCHTAKNVWGKASNLDASGERNRVC